MFMDFALYLFIILIIFKFFGVLMCPWWAIFTPLLIPFIPIVLMLVVYSVVVITVALIKPFIKALRK